MQIRRDGSSKEEQDAFRVFAGIDNGKAVFRMLGDPQRAFTRYVNGVAVPKHILSVNVYGGELGNKRRRAYGLGS